jgi:uncharacterized repeat protein (TIGR01451 family)
MVSHLFPTCNKRQVALAAGLAGILAAFTIAFADPVSPISLTKVDSPDPVASGAELTYTITAVNTGGSKVTNVVMTDQLNNLGGIGNPPQFVLTSTRGSCTQNVSLITCNGGSIEGGGVWVVTIRGIVTAAGGTTINNTASVTGTRSAQNFTTTATASTLVSGGGGTPLPDLTIAKTGPTSVAVSSPMIYTLTVNNLGTANANGIKVSDTLPLGLSGVSFSTTSLFVCTDDEPPLPHAPATITVTCTGGRVNAGSNGTITINATSPATSGTITNTASVDPDQTIDETNELNNASSLVNTQVGSTGGTPPLSIDKTDTDAPGPDFSDGAGPDPVTPGQTLTYKILVRNNATTRADDVSMVDGTTGLAAAGLFIDQVVTNGTVGNGGGCTVTAPQVKCLARTLNPGGTILYTVRGQVLSSAGSTIINTATVTGNIKNQGVSSTDTELTTVRPSVDLTITKADSPDPVCASSFPTTVEGGAEPVPTSPPLLAPPACLGGLRYTFVVGNSGVNPANPVVVRDQLPGGTIFDHVSGDTAAFAGGCSMSPGNVLTCSGGTIPAASTKTLQVYVVAPPFVGTIVNSVTVDPANAIFEADETNNSATATTTIATGVDLTIVKDDSPPKSPQGFDPIATSGTQTYVIKVDNIGPQSASNIQVRDTLPAGTVFRNAQGDHGFTCSHSNGVVDCVGGFLPGTFEEFYTDIGEQQATITIRIFAQSTVGTMHNEVRVDPLNLIPEINENNNIAFQDTTVGSGGSGMGAFNEFSITKQQTKPLPRGVPVARNAKVTYEIKVKNDGTDPAVGVVVRDFLPSGATYIEATGTNQFLCNAVTNYIECVGGQLGKIGSGTEEATITLSMFAPDTPGSYTNQAIVDPLNAIPEGNEFNNQAYEPLVVNNGGIGAFIDLTITKTPDNITVKPKDPIDYILTVKNEGEAPALNVTVRDPLPAGVTFISAQDTTLPAAPGGFTCNQALGVVTCTGATLDGSANTLATPDVPDTRTITIKVTAPIFNVPNKGLLNQAFVDPDNTIPEGNETNNTAISQITVSSAIDLRVTKFGPTESSQNEVSKYTITVYNDAAQGTSGQAAFGIKLHDPLAVGLIPLAYTAPENFACSFSENPINVFECLGDLAAGASAEITVDVFQTAEGGRSLDNEACVDPADVIVESNENNNCSTTTALSNGGTQKVSPDLLVVKAVDPSGPVNAGQALTYTVTISNVGTAKAAGPVTLTDKLPDHVTFVNYTATNGWTCAFTAPNLVCHETPAPGGGDGLEVGASASITINATYDGGATAPIVNEAKADPATIDGGPDPNSDPIKENEQNLANNVAFVKNSVGGTGIDLVVSKVVDQPDPVAPGQTLTYTVVVVNGGTEDSTTSGQQVEVRLDVPPTGLTFLSAAGSNGFNCQPPNATHQIICKGDMPGGGDTTITAKFIVNGGAPEDLVLTARVDPNNVITETNEGNNEIVETTTVAGDACPGPPCVDLVAAQISGSPDPYPNGGTVTMSFIAANIGDTGTTLDPSTGGGEPLLEFNVAATHDPAQLVYTAVGTNPAAVFSCTGTVTASAILSRCFGNLGPGEGVTVTATLKNVTSPTVSANGKVDPLNKQVEFQEVTNNGPISKTVIRQ